MFLPLSERQRHILGLVVRSYIEDGSPVGSNTLVKRYSLNVSSATVRNEMFALSEKGYIMQPHTSGGRVPTEVGYRFFVQRLIDDFQLPVFEQKTISHQFHQARIEMDQWMRLAAAVLAQTSQGASFVTSPRSKFSRFQHVQLIAVRDRQVLMIIVLYGGIVKQQMLTLATPLPQQRLSSATERLNKLFDGSNLDEIEAHFSQLDELEQDVIRLVIGTMRRLDAKAVNQIYRDGIANLLEDAGTRRAVPLLEEHSRVTDIVSDFLESEEESGVQVVIGGEGRWEDLKHCSIILARYGVNDELEGEVAVVGSMRMPYGRNISAVRYVSDIMSNLVNDYYAEEVANN